MGVSIGTIIISVIRLLRTGNLMLLCGALLLVRHTLTLPILEVYGASSSLPDWSFLLLMTAIVLTAASGYVINNIMDQESDSINHKKTGMDSISTKAANLLYGFLFISALLCAFISTKGDYGSMAFIVTAVSCGLLYFYAADYKRIPLLGNVIVASLTCLAITLPVICDAAAYTNEAVKLFIMGYGAFAFLMTLIREIIKDCEDITGDSAIGAKTLPILLGTRAASMLCGVLTLMIFASIGYIQFKTTQWDDLISFSYVSLFIQAPLLVLTVMLFRNRSQPNFHTQSVIAKLIMVAGVLSMAVFYLSIRGISW
ncbi:MAG: geranylgeranylglycerol-phosphate geranylgeranyltransferase [Bacteroidota bacterium]